MLHGAGGWVKLQGAQQLLLEVLYLLLVNWLLDMWVLRSYKVRTTMKKKMPLSFSIRATVQSWSSSEEYFYETFLEHRNGMLSESALTCVGFLGKSHFISGWSEERSSDVRKDGCSQPDCRVVRKSAMRFPRMTGGVWSLWSTWHVVQRVLVSWIAWKRIQWNKDREPVGACIEVWSLS